MTMTIWMRIFCTAGSLCLLLPSAWAGTAGCNTTGGKEIFEGKCSVCHALAENKVGPRLAGIVGRKAGSEANFGYTSALEGAGFNWDDSRLDAFLTNPARYLPGTAMAFAGMPKAQERQAVICFLGSHN